MKKRSLFVATAMLLVAVLVATGATYAWFNSATKAKTTIAMGVATGNALQIKGDTSDSVWGATLTAADFNGIGDKDWSDYSTADGLTFFSDVYADDGAGGYTAELTGFKADTTIASATVAFRASAAGKAITADFAVDNAADLNTDVRIAVNGEIFSVEGSKYQGVPAEGAVADVTLQEVTPKAFSAGTTCATLGSAVDTDGYYHATATFYFWIEGTTCENAELASVVQDIVANLTFTLAE